MVSSKIFLSGRAVTNETGGNTTYARNLLSGLKLSGIDVGLIPSYREPVLNLFAENLFQFSSEGKRSIIHYTADTGLLVKATNSPIVTTVHGLASLHVETGRSKVQERIWRARVSRAVRLSDHIITVSNTSKQDLESYFGVESEKITVIYHGIAPQYFEPSIDVEDGEILKLSNMIGDSEFALYVGNIEPRKNLLSLIQAFENPRITSLGIPLLIAGRPAWNSQEIVARLESAKNTFYIGPVSEGLKRYLMQKTALFTFPSLFEGFGLPVLEAMASGANVISSKAGSLAEVSGPSRGFSELTTEAFIEDIIAALATKQTEENKRASKNWAAKFTWQQSIQNHIDVYGRLERN